MHLVHHGLDAGKAHAGALGGGGRGGQGGVLKGEARRLPLPQAAHGDRLGRVGVLEDVGGDIVEDAPDVGQVDLQAGVLGAEVQHAGKAALAQLVGEFGQRLLKDLREGGRPLQGDHRVARDEGVFEEVVRQLLDLAGLGVDLSQVGRQLRLVLVLARGHDLGVQQQRGQRGAQVVGHLGDQVLDAGRGLGLLAALLAEGQPHRVQAGGQGGQLVRAAHRHRAGEVAALHHLHLLAEQADIAHDAPAAQQEHRQKQPDAQGHQRRGAPAHHGPRRVVVQQSLQLAVGKGDGGARHPVVEGGGLALGGRIGLARAGLFGLGLLRHEGAVDQHLVPVQLQQGEVLAADPVGDGRGVGAG